MSEIYGVTVNNFNGTADVFEVNDNDIKFSKTIKWPLNEGIDPEDDLNPEVKAMLVKIKSTDSNDVVASKVKKALNTESSTQSLSDNP
jgi:hypothetical protein